jgi:hypothetical protein
LEVTSFMEYDDKQRRAECKSLVDHWGDQAKAKLMPARGLNAYQI